MTTRSEHGFTLVEVLVAMVVLLVGVLGAVSLLDRANKTVTTTQARDDATNLARQVIETARGVAYAQLTPSSLQQHLEDQPGLADDSAAAGWQIRRRQTTYTVSVSTCTFDDPRDGAGSHDSGFCADSATPDATPPPDKNPEDYKRVRADVTWTQRGVAREVHQVELINNPGSAGATAVLTLKLSNPTVGDDTIALPSVESAEFTLTTSSPPATLHWLLDGAAQGPITTGAGTGWSFSWPLGDPSAAGSVVDGTYVVTAEAFNAYDQAGPSRSYTVQINRRAPELVSGLAGGRMLDASTGGDVVYLEWLPNRDLDITGYSVFRRDPSGPTKVCDMVTQALHCVDQSPPAGDQVHYYAVAYDRDDLGNTRAGAAPGAGGDLVVTTGNTPPNPVTGLTAGQDADGNVTLSWDRAAVPDPDPGDGVDFYRVYRDGIAVGDPYARWDDDGAHVTWMDSNTGGTTHRYWVTAVDQHYGESMPVGPVSP